MKIALVSTGGTIAMTKGPGEDASSLLLGADRLAIGLRPDEIDEISTIDFSRLPSSNFDSNYAQRLANKIRSIHESKDPPGGIVVTHGTDTMEETAFYLELVNDNGIPIVFTGAMKTADQPGYDGTSNLTNALKVVKSPGSLGKGVLIVFDNDIMSAVHGTKADSEKIDAFGSLQTGKIGSINGENILYYYEPKKHIKLKNKIGGKAALLKMHYDIEIDVVDFACKTSDIIVVECYGSGRVPPRILPALEEATAELIILTTRVPNGHLYDTYSYDGSYQYLLKRGFIMSPLASPKTCILAKLCLGNGKGYGEVREIFQTFFQ